MNNVIKFWYGYFFGTYEREGWRIKQSGTKLFWYNKLNYRKYELEDNMYDKFILKYWIYKNE